MINIERIREIIEIEWKLAEEEEVHSILISVKAPNLSKFPLSISFFLSSIV